MTKITNNQRTTLAVLDDVTGNPMYLKGLNGALDVNATISSATVSGSKSNNAGVPGATNLGVLPAIATAAAPTYTEGNQVGLSTDLAGNVRVTGSISVGGTTDNSAFTAGSSTGTAAMGFYHSTIDAVTDGRAATVAITAKRAMMVNLQTSTGAETGIAALPLQVSLANTGANSNKLLVTPDSVALPANQSVNISQINAVTPLMGNGLTGTGSLRVTVASDNTAFAVNSTLSAETTKVIGTVNIAASQTIAVTNTGTFTTQSTLAAETTKVIGVVRTADGAGNLLTSNSTTYTAKFGLDGNLLGTLGTAFSTAGKVDVKGADGDVFVRQATGTNLHTVVDSGTITTVSTLTGTTTLTPGTGLANLGKAEDQASADTDVGVAALLIRQAAPANTSGTDGDYEFGRMANGRQWVWSQPNIVTISTTITRPADTNAYAANDVFANSTTVPTAGGFTFTGAALVSGGSGVISDCVISASAGTVYIGEVWIFDQAVTAKNDNAAFDVSDSDVQNLVAVIPFQTSDTTSSNSVSYTTGLEMPYTCVGTANLRFLVKIMSAVTPGNAEVLAVRIKVAN